MFGHCCLKEAMLGLLFGYAVSTSLGSCGRSRPSCTAILPAMLVRALETGKPEGAGPVTAQALQAHTSEI